MAVHTIEICAGVGMLGEGLRAGLDYLGIPLRTVCYVEREAYAAAVLAARCEEGSLDDAPVWSDLLTFDAGAWRGAVDGIVAGFPCQDLSLAGRRAGLDGKRSGLFFNILDIADACGAQFLFLENVAGIASATASVVDEAEGDLEERAAARVVGELADRGWDAEWLTLSASEVGASHGRERWFCLAWRRVGNAGLQHQYVQQWADGAEHQGAGQPVAHAERAERWPGSVGGTGSQQGNDGIGRQADGGAGEPDEALGYTNSGAARCELQQRGCTCGNDAWKLQPGQPEFPGLSMGYPECPRWPQAGRGPEQHAGGEPEPGCGAAECEFCGYQFPEELGRYGCPNCEGDGLNDVADPSSPRQQGGEQRGACTCNGGAGSTWIN